MGAMESRNLGIVTESARLMIESLELAIDRSERHGESFRGPCGNTGGGAQGSPLSDSNTGLGQINPVPGRKRRFDGLQQRHRRVPRGDGPRTPADDEAAPEAPAADKVTPETLEVATGLVIVGADRLPERDEVGGFPELATATGRGGHRYRCAARRRWSHRHRSPTPRATSWRSAVHAGARSLGFSEEWGDRPPHRPRQSPPCGGYLNSMLVHFSSPFRIEPVHIPGCEECAPTR